MADAAASTRPKRAAGNRPNGGEATAKGEGYPQNIHRALPHNADAEMVLLGSIFLDPVSTLTQHADELRPDHFHLPAHRTIYSVIADFTEARKPIELPLITAALQDRHQLEEVGGPAYLARLATCTATPANFPFYLAVVRSKYLLRQVIVTCSECIQRAYSDQDEEQVASVIDEVEQKVFAITKERAGTDLPKIDQQVMVAVDNLNALFGRQGISGLPTGFPDLDRMTDGLHPAEMIVIAARPSMGKTALAMNIAEHVAIDQKKPVAVFSLEMSSAQLIQRLICCRARIDLQQVRDGFSPQSEFRRIPEVAQEISDSLLYIDDTPSLSILDLRARARRLKAKHDLALIVIDYLQLLRSTSRRSQDSRQIEITEVSAGIKGLAKELDIPIIVLSQLNRKPDDRGGGRPRLSDLRESGSIEQDADLVGLLVRPEVYEDDGDERDRREGEAELIIAKQRNGPVGEVPFTFLKRFTRFEPRAHAPH